MRVCFIVPGYYPEQGRTAHYEFSQNLANLGVEVDVLATRRPTEADRDRVGSLHVYRLPVLSVGTERKVAFIQRTTQYLKSLSFQYDIIHVFHFRGCGLVRVLEPRRASKWVVDIRSPALASGVGGKRRRELTRIETRLFHLTLVHSYAVGIEIFGSNRAFVEMPIGVNLDRFRPSSNQRERIRKELQIPDDKILVVYVGSVHPQRQLNEMVRGFAEALPSCPHLMLLIVGDGPNISVLRDVVRSLGIEASTFLTGYVDYSRVPEYLNAADICLSYVPMVRYYDHAPVLKTLEYLASGKPVLATLTHGNRELIRDGENGILVADDHASIAQGILRLANDSHLRQKLISAARSSVSEYDWKHIVEKRLLPMYEQLLGSSLDT